MGRTPGPTSITVRVADADGGPDLEIRFDPSADLTAADLVAAWPTTGPAGLVVDGRPVPDQTPLPACGLADGATVGVGTPPVARPELVVVAGPLPPTSLALDGPVLIGRGLACDLRLDHLSVVAAHALVEPDGRGWTACSLDGPTLLDGQTLHSPVRLGPGSVVSVGAVDLQLLGDDPPRPVAPPRAPVHRAAQPPDAEVRDPGPPPELPAVPAPPSPPGVLTLVVPLVVGAVLAVAVHPTAGLITAGMPVVALGAHLDARRRHRRDRHRAETEHAEAVAHHHRAVDEVGRELATRRRHHFPTVADAVHRARTGVGLWPVRDEGVDDLAVGWSDDALRSPVVVDTGRGALGIAGPRPWADAVARAVLVQAAARCGPNQRSVPSDRAQRWLPHACSSATPLLVEVAARPDLLTDHCTATLVWSPDGARLADRADGRRDVPVRPFVAAAAHTEAFARACARWTDSDLSTGALPDEVGLVDLDLDGGHDGRRTLAAPLGVGVEGPVVVDLVADGPHALVAGTTGSGKSELLRTWVAALAARHPPTAVAFVLVDYKGGSAFDAVARLPHVTGVVTDLDPGLGERLLVGLSAEVRERESLLRAVGVTDVRVLPDGPPRLVVVVDEFATLAAELPDFLGALVDVARRGRSLGVHLVLATQRPAGAVNDDIRANTSLRVCLRTLDTADAQDVIGDPRPATLPSNCPGRAWLRRGDRPELVQVASGHRPTRRDRPPLEIRFVDTPWPTDDGPTELDELVDATVAAWADRPVPASTWLPPLPERLTLAIDPDPDALVLGLVDQPAARRQHPLTWRPVDGHLVVLGGRRSGRTTAVTNVVLALAENHDPDDLHVFVVDGGRDGSPLSGLPHVGAVVAAQDRATVRRLVGRLARGGTAARTVLVVDGFDTLAAGLDDVDGVRLLEAIDGLVRRDVNLVVTSTRPSRLPPSLLAHSASTVVLRLDDAADLAVLGLRPSTRAQPPGRGWTLNGDEVQLVAPPEPDVATAVAKAAAVARPGDGPASIGPLPCRVTLSDLGPADGLVTVGLRDDDLVPARLAVDPGAPFVVCGPPRSGRSHALELVLRQLPGGRSCSGDDPAAFVDEVHRWLADPRPWTFAIDDAERLDDPDGTLRELIVRRHPDARVLVAVRTDAWRSAYGSWLADLRPAAVGIALSPDLSRDAELWTAPLRPLGPTPPPGRGLLVSDGRADLVQVAVDG